jgi:predicted ATPase
MLKSITLKNFKPFENQSFDLKSLTLLSGLNSSGKSSLLQALLLLRQSYQQGLLRDKGLALNGDLVCIGTAKDALFEAATEDIIGFDVCWKNEKKGSWRFNYNREADVIEIAKLFQIDSEIYNSSLFNDKFVYLQAERLGPRPYFEMSDFQVRQHQKLGSKGEYTAHFLSIYGGDPIPSEKLSHLSATSLQLQHQVEAWMGEVSPGTRINIIPNSAMDLVNLQYSYELSNLYRSTNVGFGISYTLPILVAILAAQPDTLILLENPEAHLHPKGQAKIGELLALAASYGVQIIVETHSDHILNGIRLAVHGGQINPEDVQLHYFQRQEKDRQWVTEVVSPKIDRNGRIDRWPDGFFDEWDKSLEILLASVDE